ncbi:MAG: YraN family protein [Lactobacillales bacterium]|jgi:putative endonuclease|nr:YraN family protein [Lactobacillales bacterium]
MRKHKTYKTGRLAEWASYFFLIMKGYRPLARNFKVGKGTGAGEIDLIFKKGKTLVFVEVKYRRTLTDALHAITINNQQRTVRSSAVFLQRYPQYGTCDIRYDAVLLSPGRWPKHLPGAWRVL